jgi:diguanylate cyclase (GGDEF)-like protein
MIELLCTLTGIIAGIAVVASLIHHNEEKQKFTANPNDSDPDGILGIADQLQVISHRVAADVSAHSEKVVHMSDRLVKPSEPNQILSTITEIISANQAMQGQLADAQKRIAQQSRMIETASHQARTDALTGLSNRRALDEFLNNCISNQNEGEVVALLLMDIDHFKSFNDSFGHTTGDAVLASFARSLSVCCGEECYSARFGGEEFAVILTGQSIQEVVEKATEVRFYISEQVICYEDLRLKITSSAGLCVLQAEDTANSVYERADEGLYQSKKAGRNRGFWLSIQGWQPFPERTGTPRLLSELRAEETSGDNSIETPPSAPSSLKKPLEKTPPMSSQIETASSGPDITLQSDPLNENESLRTKLPSKEATQTPSAEGTEILDLSSFILRLDAFLEQLRKADLPAAAVMIEAIGMQTAKNGEGGKAAEYWEQIVEVVQRNLRGIDVVCQYRPRTLCVFMPGCSLDAGIERAANIQSALRETSFEWDSALGPERFAVAIGGIGTNEDNASFLNRLEVAIEEALDAADTELVVHNGKSCYFQQA